jgi:GTPase Era involved in 16S rRNA processing
VTQKNTSKQIDQMDENDALQIWADITAHLQFAEQVLQKSDLQSQPRTKLLERIQHIRNRQNDPNMYLAVVGEFNTGKSTFINALLHEELLQTSVVVATATSTRICYGTQVDLEVRFRNTKSALHYRQNREQLWRQIQKYSRKFRSNEQDIRAYIEAVTANNDVAAHVESVVLYHPTAFLTNKIIIIDTPGINAEFDAHRQITSNVVQHEADAAVIIIPAPVPLSQTLTAFLLESLRPYLHRCLFVVTQMDKIQERERQRLLTNIQTRLASGINQSVVLHEAAPQIVLDTLQKQPVAAGAEHWYDDFGKLEQALWDRLRQERALNITESLLRLMTMLFEELGARLRERQSTYEARQQAIQRETIQDISAFVTQQQRTYQTLLSSAASSARYNLKASIASQSSDTEEEIRDAIFSVDSASNLKSAMEEAVKEEMGQASRAFQRNLEKQIEMLKLTTVRASQAFDARFAQEYQKLRALAGSVSFVQMEQFNQDMAFNTSSISYSAGKINDELDGSMGKLGWGGAAIGAAIGTAILPGIGTLAGMFVGPILVGLFGPSLHERKTQVWNAVSQALQEAFQNMETQGLTILSEYEGEVERAFQRRISTYMQQYKKIVDSMIQNQQSDLKAIQNVQRTIQSDQQEIERRRISLQGKQQQIAQKKR